MPDSLGGKATWKGGVCMDCPPCNGTGKAWEILGQKCPRCRGIGRIDAKYETWPICRRCEGSGRENRILNELCSTCGGYGHLPPESVPGAQGHALSVFFIEAGKPHTAHDELSSFFEKLQGCVRVCDPYYGVASLYRLALLQNCRSVLFLTKTPDSHERSFLPASLREYKVEHPEVEFRQCQGREVHDRFVLAEDELILLGHGLKDIGKKESFVVKINKELAGDVIDCVRASFDDKWNDAVSLV